MKKISILMSSLLATSLSIAATPIEQRQLSTNANNPLPSAVTSNQSWEMYQSIQQLQNQVRQLLGQIEEQNHQIEQLNNDLKNRYTDLDQRLDLLNQKVDPEAYAEEQTPEQTDNSTATTVAAIPADQAEYQLAYEAYKQGGAAKAIAPMQNFIKNHPNSSYVSHAYYWLGEFNLSLTPPNFNQAKDNFSIVSGNYPKSNKAPAALYRLSELAKNIDKDIPRAREYYLKLIQNYPESQEAKIAKTAINL